MSSPEKFYLTTPIYYVNARPHIGHAYSTIVADVIARRHRLLGDDTWFLTGTDEHGQKIERSAQSAGVPPQQFTDQVSAQFRQLWDRMGITYNDYIRTTSDRHKRGAQKLFSDLYERGKIYLSSYTGQYSIGEEMFVEGPPGTIGPDGRPTETVTEENFFFKLSDYQLRLLNLIESNELLITPESSRNEVLNFLRGNVASVLDSRWQELEAAGEFSSITVDSAQDPSESAPAPATIKMGLVLDSCLEDGSLKRSAGNLSYVPGALRDLSVSRSSFTWGIPVPEPAASATQQKHVIYVWLDALANYMTAVGYGCEDPADKAMFARFWPANLHLVGKEITRFHCVYWPAFLMAAGLPTPKAVTANGWLLFDNSKMSKSKGNVVRTETILDGFGEHVYKKQFPDSTKREQDLFGADVLRYFLLREIPFGQDGSFSFDAMITRYNADLANGYGNLVSRTLAMLLKYFPDGKIPNLDQVHDHFSAGERAHIVGNIGFSVDTLSKIDALLVERQEDLSTGFANALTSIGTLIKWTDEILTMFKPWTERETSEVTSYVRTQCLYQAAESIRLITAMFYPILPYSTAKVWAQLGLGDIEEAAATGQLKNLQWGGLQPGTKLGTLAPIFPRADKGLSDIMADMESPAKPTVSHLIDESNSAPAAPQDTTHPTAGPRTIAEPNSATQVAGSAAITTERPASPSHAEAPASGIFASQAPETTGPADASPQITIDDFAKVELRVAQILVAERIPKADKLLRLEVDLGYEKRQILSGIAEWYTPEDLIGRRIVVITNLAPRKMRGLESHGMLLAASHGEGGKPVLATFGEEIALGARLK